MKIAIIGFGREGRSVYEYWKKSKKLGLTQIPAMPTGRQACAGMTTVGGEIWVLDRNVNLKVPAEIKARLGENYLDNLDEFDLIFRSPGVPYNLIKSKIKNQKSKLLSATRLFFDLCPCPIIGVTGTKGKGTTCTMIYQALKNSGKDVFLVGNIGKPALDILPQLSADSLVIYELSSFQLQDLHKSPTIAALLDIFPDHQDAHESYEEYVEAKMNIAKWQMAKDQVFYFGDNPEINLIRAASFKAKRGEINIEVLRLAQELPFQMSDLKIPGEHNFKNALMAYRVAEYLGCPKEKIKEAILGFNGNEHRLELVKNVGSDSSAGMTIRYYNDSASTNPQTTLAAVRAFVEPKILVVGGFDKGLDYAVWGEEFPKLNVKAVILMGANKNKILENLIKIIPTYDVVNLEGAVKKALNLAVGGDIVLFSPGAASFDMFKDYADRGKKFKEVVKSLTI